MLCGLVKYKYWQKKAKILLLNILSFKEMLDKLPFLQHVSYA